ncbi:alkaline phosphatase [Lichtheimia corymbifera JMRC:FSU:9682]|uniref:alkaline phosphatase n=1 Tax=Lichtheimia corymbifera JMRC:FSU:9682 TaxID=1263082 RepID=A0A068SF90_9FUNG|nr:alkaline phosphatase [Lichtheimia corymbifera JMRC:FSU:9682]
MKISSAIATLAAFATVVNAARPSYKLIPDPEGQYPRLGACPDEHACIFPPDVSTFLPGAYFDLRVELHAYDKDNSTVPEPYTSFKTLVRKDGKGKWQNADDFFGFEQTPALENWNFTWANTIEATLKEESGVDVAVTSRIWRKIKFDEPGTYDVAVQYGPKDYYTVRYNVVQPKTSKKKAKNAILFIADGCNVGMITAARALGRMHTSGKYHNLLSFEDFDNLGHVLTNSVDGLVTDSANSASAYATGHKASVNALGVYADSSSDPFDDPKVELITELIRRRQPGKAVGVVSTAYGQDATPAAFYVHTRRRGESGHIVDQLANGVANWTEPVAPDVWLAGGAEYFKGEEALNETDYYDYLQDHGYKLVLNKKELKKYKDDEKLLGVFRTGNLDPWMERNILVNNTVGNGAAPDLSGKDALGSDQPGLTDMTLKALEVLKKRGGDDGFFLMSEAASVDKQLHPLDFTRAYGELLEMDVTIAKTVEWLKKNGEYEDTLILFTADHAHPFDVWGSVDQEYIQRKTSSEREMRDSIGLYAASGWPGYFDEDGDGFPDNWHPKITLAAGVNDGPDHYEAFAFPATGTRVPAVKEDGIYVANKEDQAGNYGAGLEWHGNLPVSESQGVHSMSDVFIYSNGPGSELFKKTIENWQVFFGLTEALGLQEPVEGENKN